MQGRSSFNTVLWVPRYWPAVGGTEFHTRRLANLLCAYHPVKVVTHCNHSSGQYTLPQEVARAETSTLRDGDTSIALVGAEQRYQQFLFSLASHYEQQPLVRSLYQHAFNRALQRNILSAIADAHLIHFVYNGLTDAASLALQLCEKRGIPLVLTPNVLDTKSERSAWNSRRFIHLYNKADQIIALTTHEAEWLVAQGAPEKSISVIPYGPILETAHAVAAGTALDQATADLLKKPYILYLGRMVPEKGYPVLFDAFKQLCGERKDINLVIVGIEEPEVAARLAALNDQSGEARAVFINNPSQEIKTAIIERALTLCVPSSIESLGGVYIEAMACGIR